MTRRESRTSKNMGFFKAVFAVIGIAALAGAGFGAWNNPGLMETDRDTAVKGLKNDLGYFIAILILAAFRFFKLNESLYTFG